MKKSFRWIIALLILLYSGCTNRVLVKPPNLKFADLSMWPMAYRQNFERLKTMKNPARISVESPEYAASFDISIIYTAPDTLYMQAEGPFGIDLGKIFIGKHRFIIFNQFNNQFFSGDLDEDYYNTFLQTDLTFRQIKYAFLGYVSLPENLKLVDENHGIFAALVDAKKWRIKVDQKTGNLLTLEIFENNQKILTEEFKNYQNIAGVIIPRLIRIINPLKKEMVAILYKNLKINEVVDKDSYHIEIKPKTKQLVVGR